MAAAASLAVSVSALVIAVFLAASSGPPGSDSDCMQENLMRAQQLSPYYIF